MTIRDDFELIRQACEKADLIKFQPVPVPATSFSNAFSRLTTPRPLRELVKEDNSGLYWIEHPKNVWRTVDDDFTEAWQLDLPALPIPHPSDMQGDSKGGVG